MHERPDAKKGEGQNQTSTEERLSNVDYTGSDWNSSPARAPLFYWPITDVPVNKKLKQIQQALESGHDPNEVDQSTHRQYQHGRPLNMCMNESKALGNGSHVYENAAVIKLLLKHGADPRLYGVPSNPHGVRYPGRPLDEARACVDAVVRHIGDGGSSRYHAPHEVEFFKEAYRLMKEATERLHGKERSRCAGH